MTIKTTSQWNISVAKNEIFQWLIINQVKSINSPSCQQYFMIFWKQFHIFSTFSIWNGHLMQSGNQGNKIILSAGFVQSNKNVFCSQNRIKWKYIQIYRLVFRMFLGTRISDRSGRSFTDTKFFKFSWKEVHVYFLFWVCFQNSFSYT